MGQHANSYLLLFSHPYLVESLLRDFVPGDWVRDLDFSSLEKIGGSYATDDLRSRHDDLIWKVRRRDGDRWIYIYLLLEFQSTSEYFMAVRIMTYQGLLYQDLIRLLNLGSGDLLPQILPIVLYNGHAPWRAPTNVVELVSQGPAALDPFRPRLEYLLLDERALLEKARETRHNPVASLFRLGHGELWEMPGAAQALNESLLGPQHAELRRALSIWYLSMVRHREKDIKLPESLDLEEIPAMLTEQAPSWTAMLTDQGRQEGHQEGRLEGRQEGEATMLLRLLKRRFGSLAPELRQRVKDADADCLLEWGDRILTAERVEDVFVD